MAAQTFDALIDDILLLILHSLPDADLLSLCQVSRLFHRLALVDTFLPRHDVSIPRIETGALSVTSQSLPGLCLLLPSFVPPFQKLVCVFEHQHAERNFRALQQLVSRLGCIDEVAVSTLDADDDSYRRLSARCTDEFNSLILTFIPQKMSAALVIMNQGYIYVSRPHRILRLPERSSSFRISNSRDSWLGMMLKQVKEAIVYTVAHVSSCLNDPHGRQLQDVRILQDVGLDHNDCPHVLHLKRPPLPSSRSLQWTMISRNTVEHLMISNIPALRGKWSALLSSIHLPSLTELEVGSGVNLSFSSFSSIILRHPTIDHLTLGHYGLLFDSSAEDFAQADWLHALSRLTHLTAPIHWLAHILLHPGADFPSLSDVQIGPSIPYHRTFLRGYSPDRKIQIEPFSFVALDKLLKVIARMETVSSLGVTIPASTPAKRWLTVKEGGEDRPERRLHHLKYIWLGTERAVPLNRKSCEQLLPRWFALFPDLETAKISGWIYPTHYSGDALLSVIRSSVNPQVGVYIDHYNH